MPSKTRTKNKKLYKRKSSIYSGQAAKMTAKHARDAGHLAFLSPIKRKNKPTKYHIYVHERKKK